MIDLETICRSARRSVVSMNARTRSSHSGSALSIIDILAVLYFRVLKIDPYNPAMEERDRFILSKGHASAALYAMLVERGFFSKKKLDEYYCNGGSLPGHIDKESAPGLECSAGSLGHGLSIGTGMALHLKRQKKSTRVFVLMGDGEMNEGSVWEAMMMAAHQKLSGLCAIIDCNGLQGYGRTGKILDLEPLAKKLSAFRWDVCEVDGHDLHALEMALTTSTDKPKAIIARTTKGKGVSYMEDSFEWHYKSPDTEQLRQALKELE